MTLPQEINFEDRENIKVQSQKILRYNHRNSSGVSESSKLLQGFLSGRLSQELLSNSFGIKCHT